VSDEELTPEERRRLGLRIPNEPGLRKTRDQRVIEAVEARCTGPKRSLEAELVEPLGTSDDAGDYVDLAEPEREEDEVVLRGGLTPEGSDPPGWQPPHVNSPYGKSANRWNSLTDPHGDRL
jgi:hypothetical protein